MEVHPSIVSEIVKRKELFLIMASESAKVLENVWDREREAKSDRYVI